MSEIRVESVRKLYRERRRGWRSSDSTFPSVQGSAVEVLAGIDFAFPQRGTSLYPGAFRMWKVYPSENHGWIRVRNGWGGSCWGCSD